jgi:effector-binding domain-containing protein
MDYLIATRELPKQPIVSMRDRRPQQELPAFLGEAFGALFGKLGLLGVAPSGPPFVIYHEFGPDGVDAEVCLPIAEAVTGISEPRSRVLPPVTVASTLHVGRYEKLTAAYAALMEWIRRHEFEAAGPAQERYLSGPGDGVLPEEYRTELEIPIVPAAAAVPR